MQLHTICKFLLLEWIVLSTDPFSDAIQISDEDPMPSYGLKRISKRNVFLASIPTTDCRSRIGNLLVVGTCDTIGSCALNGGTVVGFCTGNAICCLVTHYCGAVASTRLSYFVTPDFPAAVTPPSNCELTIRPYMKTKTCQVFLEFLTLELDAPDASGACTTSSFKVRGSDPNYLVPDLCGYNTDQHMYISFAPYEGEIKLQINNAVSKFWIIKVTQIPCTPVTSLPPAGCLQYYNGSKGTVKSFNRDRTTPHALQNQDYDICLRPVTGNCSYQWTPTLFSITNVISGAIGYNETTCINDDYISVLSAQATVTGGTILPKSVRSNIYCGGAGTPPANAESLSTIKTFQHNRMSVHFDNIAQGQGFQFNFLVNCSSVLIEQLLSIVS